ncbi:hypothetical protein [Streptomyces sp. NPDC051211]|uniref:hypothetical protein n=1 Tax=Streptomyces sp. NPDC051211 TaxID=3154643 RepID=UPI00344E5DE3
MPDSSWFVESRGRLPEQDYSWQAAGAGGQDVRAAAQLLARGCRGNTVYDLIDDSASSLLLYCADGGNGGAGTAAAPVWLLLITGLRGAPDDRTDHMGRTIRASVLGVGSGSGSGLPPADLLAVAHRFLLGGLSGPLPVEYGLPVGTAGFAVDAAGWEALLAETRAGLPAGPEPAGPYDPGLIRVDRDTADTRRRAAAILLEVAQQAGDGAFDPAKAQLLGKEARPLLVITSLLGLKSLRELRPLHALSPRVDGRKDSHVQRESGLAASKSIAKAFSRPFGSLFALVGLALLAVSVLAVWR